MKKVIGKIIILAVIFIAAIFTYMFIKYKKPGENGSVIMEGATLPIVNFIMEGRNVNYLHGYTMKMDVNYMREALTVADGERKLNVTVTKYGNSIVKFGYEIRSRDGGRLIEDGEVGNRESAADYVKAEIELGSIIKDNTEYQLIIKLGTELVSEINYYTGLIIMPQNDIEKHLDFAEYFSEAARDETKSGELSKYREYDKDKDHNNLGYVDIYTTQNQLTWGELKVEQVGGAKITVKEVYSEFGEYVLEYMVRALNDYDTYQYYNVREFFRLRLGITGMYVYAYERTMDQIFDPITQNISATRINLGIDSDLSVDYDSSPGGTYVCFVKEGTLWRMSLNDNIITPIFSFSNPDVPDIRLDYKEHDIEVISVNSDGDVNFLVYGYMNAGMREGKCCVSVYRYTGKKNMVEELLFLPSTKPYQILKETAGRFAYVTDSGMVYIMMEDSVYSISLQSNESVQLVRGLGEGSYAINKDRNIIAWHEGGSIYRETSIRIINIKTGDDYKIMADEGEYIRILGFIGDDVIYGNTKAEDMYEDEAGHVTCPMYKITVNIGGKQEETQTYKKDNIYVSDIEISDNMIILYRIVREGNKFVQTDQDRFIGRSAASGILTQTGVISTELKKKEMVLNFAYTVTSSDKLRKMTPEAVVYGNSEERRIETNTKKDTALYVYANGRMAGIYTSGAKAIEKANGIYGIVTDSSGSLLWGRVIRPNRYSIDGLSIITAEQGDGQNSFDTAIRTIMNHTGSPAQDEIYSGNPAEILSGSGRCRAIDFSGGDILNSVYYISRGEPVMTKINGQYALITGYSGTINTIDTFTVLDLVSGKYSTHTTQEIKEMTEVHGSIFIGVYKEYIK